MAPARVAIPSIPSARSGAGSARSGAGILRAWLPIRERQPQNVGRQLLRFLELLGGEAGLCTRCLLRNALLDRQRLDQAQHVVRLLGTDAGDAQQILALQIDNV